MTERGLEINDAKDWRQGYHLFSQMTSHTLSSRIHPRGTLPIMAWKWRKMKSQNDRLKRDYFWCSIPCGGHYLALFFLFTWHRPLSSLQKKKKITQKTTDWWRMGVLFSQTEKKKPQIITAKTALWVTELVSGCDKCFSFWTCQKKMNLRCTAGHLGCWASALCLNTPQAFHQRGTNAEHRL